MSETQIPYNLLLQKYKEKKSLFSDLVINMFTSFLQPVLIVWALISCCIHGVFSDKTLTNLLISLVPFLIKIVPSSSDIKCQAGLILFWILDLRCIQTAFWKFPEFSGIMIACSVSIMINGQLELIYMKYQGYIILVGNLFIWIFFALYSGFIKSFPPPEIIFTIFSYLAMQIITYRYQYKKDFEEIQKTILLETQYSNTNNLINSIPEGLIVIDRNQNVLMSNLAGSDLFLSFKIDQILFLEKYKTANEDFKQSLQENISVFWNSNKISTVFGVALVSSNYLECTGTKIKWYDSDSIVLTFRKITSLVLLENEINLKSKMLKILRGVSHELKTPVNQIINQLIDISDHKKDISVNIENKIKRTIGLSFCLLYLIRDMIDYSQLKSNNLALAYTWVQVGELAQECIQTFKDINSSCVITLENYLNSCVLVYTDKNRLRQVLLSLGSISLG